MPIDTVAVKNNAAVMVLHVVICVDLLHGERLSGRDLEQIAADFITGGHIDMIVVVNGGRDYGRAATSSRAPENSAIFCINSSDTCTGELNVLTHATDLRDDR